ncbi:MAG: hypothetical protein WDW38_004014 [Sanguina aurantia]
MEINVKKKVLPTRGVQQQPALAPWGPPQPQHAKLQLSRVFGVGSPTPNAMLCHPTSPELLAYTCGCVAVLYNASTRQQRFFKSKTADKVLSCLAFSEDGCHLAAGEKGGSAPDVQLWDLASGRMLPALRGHKYGIGALAFGGDGKLLASAGLAYDGQICLWDWATSALLCRHYTQAEVHSLSFTDHNTAIAAVGKDYFKALSLSFPAGRARAATGGGATLTARPATLKDFRAATFVAITPAPAPPAAAAVAASAGAATGAPAGAAAAAVAAGRAQGAVTGQQQQQQQPEGSGAGQALYALTSSGVLLLMRPSGRTVDKSVSLQVATAFALATSAAHVACACASGVVRLFQHHTLAFQFNLPRPAGRGGAAAAAGRRRRGGHIAGPADCVPTCSRDRWRAPGVTSLTTCADLFPDALACSFGCTGKQLSVVYSDRSLVMWDAAVLVASPAYSGASAAAARPPTGLAGRMAAAASAAPCLLRCLRWSCCRCRGAHDAEVLSLSYSPVDGQGRCLLASSSRDMLVHVYDALRNYELLQTCEEHGGAVTAVRFSPCGRRLLSCGADRTVIFRNVSVSFPAATPKRPVGSAPTGHSPAVRLEVYCRQAVPKGALFDLALDVCGQIAVTVGADGMLRAWDVVSGAAGRVTAVAQDGLTGGYLKTSTSVQVAAAGRARDIADAATHAVREVIRQALEMNVRKGLAVGSAAAGSGAVAVAGTPAARVQPEA